MSAPIRNTLCVFDVEYTHLAYPNGDDLYITAHGRPCQDLLDPANYWTDTAWFKANSERLSGTSCVYKIRTRAVEGHDLNIVLKWNRMGQNVPIHDFDDELASAEFNSPFEEFALVQELRAKMLHTPEVVCVQTPLAIYVPHEHKELWRTGRTEYKMRAKILQHEDCMLDIYRSYAVIYEWLEGIDASEAQARGLLDAKQVKALTLDAEHKLEHEGFRVRDRKPHHIILTAEQIAAVNRQVEDNVEYGLIDFELLEKMPEEQLRINRVKRLDYHKRQRDRFARASKPLLPAHLRQVNVMGVDYIVGQAESTKGLLWVVGKDPALFEFFLPERWEQRPRLRLSCYDNMYYTVTKDNIHLVWKISRVGVHPDMDPFKDDERTVLEYGYNSPFEEVALAVELQLHQVDTIYPRAIYMTGATTEAVDHLYDDSRYESHAGLRNPDGSPILRKDRDYIGIWGYWNGPDEKLASEDDRFYEAIGALRAYRQGIIDQRKYIFLLGVARDKLLRAGIHDLNMRGTHILIDFDDQGRMITDVNGLPEFRISNFEFLKRMERSS